MSYINENYLNLKESYLFKNIADKVAKFQEESPEKDIIKLGIGDVTKPIVPTIIEALHKAVDEMGNEKTFKGYGPEQGYKFLKEKIVEEYKSRNVKIEENEIFISDGAKSDTGNIGDIFSKENVIGITDPVYPVYIDTNIMAGRKVVYLPCNKENGFIPKKPEEKIDILYLCYPNNPTGTTLKKSELKEWVDWANKNKVIIFFDAAYEAYITDEDIPHSIFEIEGAKNCAIEFRSFSKNAGFTGLRCGFTIIPKDLIGYTKDNKQIEINKLWNRRHTTKFNGTAYIIQKAAEAVYTKAAQEEINENIKYYMKNAKLIRETLERLGYEVYGGKNAPYIWLKTPNNLTSWEFFDKLLNEANVVGTPGSGFGENGEGYFRLTAFGTRENTIEALKRIEERLK